MPEGKLDEAAAIYEKNDTYFVKDAAEVKAVRDALFPGGVMAREPASIRSNSSSENVEKVVKPPHIPTFRNTSRRVSTAPACALALTAISPMQKAPIALIIIVVSGKPFSGRSGIRPIRYLAIAPSMGAVTVLGNASLDFSAGVISDNSVTGNRACGGGICVYDFSTAAKDTDGYVPAPENYITKFTMTGGTVSGNSAVRSGGGIYVQSLAASISGGTISGNKAGFMSLIKSTP